MVLCTLTDQQDCKAPFMLLHNVAGRAKPCNSKQPNFSGDEKNANYAKKRKMPRHLMATDGHFNASHWFNFVKPYTHTEGDEIC